TASVNFVSMKATDPVGVSPAPVTVAVNVTGEPNVDGFRDDVRDVELCAGKETDCTVVAELDVKWLSPLYVAATVFEPLGSAEIMNVACPVPSSVTVPSTLLGRRSVTVPLGVNPFGVFGVTVMENVTVWPDNDGFGDEVSVVVVELTPPFTVWVTVF